MWKGLDASQWRLQNNKRPEKFRAFIYDNDKIINPNRISEYGYVKYGEAAAKPYL